jgi:hypothetical protein
VLELVRRLVDSGVALAVMGNHEYNFIAYHTEDEAGNKLRALGEDTESLMYDAMSQDLDFRNRLIEIFGRPYDGTIGFGKAYPEGYEGPDTLLFAYLDKIKIDRIIPQKSSGKNAATVVAVDEMMGQATSATPYLEALVLSIPSVRIR